MPSCLAGCISRYECGGIQQTIEADSLAPYVKLFFESPDSPTVTVGNESAPQFDHHAVIKSFQYGGSDGNGITVEILDEQGGNFHAFADKMNKCLGRTSRSYIMKCQFGWVGTLCGSQTGGIIKASPIMTFLLLGLEINFADGKIKFTITGKDLMQNVFNARHDEIQGSDPNPVTIKQAIIKLCDTNEPKMNVAFLRMLPSGTFMEYGFKEKKDGPEASWDSDGQNKLATIMKWLEPFVTDRDKGILPVWDSLQGQPTLILLEDPRPDCAEITGCDQRVVGTWIVNGGSCSPVISFSPKINWNFAAVSGATGNAGSTASGEFEEKEKKCQGEARQTGITQSIPITRQGWDHFGPGRVVEETERSQRAHRRTNQVTEGITGELRIQGDPREIFCNPLMIKGRFASLVVINPFHLFGAGVGDCPEWLAQPGCNEVLSNRKWRIEGFEHNIKEGSYVTTLKLKLDVPGIDIDSSVPVGGDTTGWNPPETC